MDMVEQVARAICDANLENPDFPNRDGGFAQWKVRIPDAKAAIAAMREIPPETIFYAQKANPKFMNNCGVFWRGIIDAALGKTP